MDLTIPGGMGGKDAVRLIKEVDPEVPVLVVSGYSNDPVMADHESYGFDGMLAKPFKGDELVALIKQKLSQANRLEEPAAS